MRQVFANLLDNALKYTPDSGKVSVSIESDEEVARVKFRDTGIRKQHVNLAGLLGHDFVQLIQIAQLRYVAAHRDHVIANRLDRFVQRLLIAPRNHHFRALLMKPLGRRQPDPAVSASHYCHFPFESLHVISLYLSNVLPDSVGIHITGHRFLRGAVIL